MLNKFIPEGVFNGVVKVIAYAAAASIVIISIVFAFVMLRPVDVLDNWRLQTIGDTFAPGQEITLVSTVNKLMNVNGESHRTLVCSTDGVEESFDLPDSTANRSAGPHATQVTVILPSMVAKLPRTCHININVDYLVYGVRHFPESVDSNPFTLAANAPEPATSQDQVPTSMSVPSQSSGTTSSSSTSFTTITPSNSQSSAPESTSSNPAASTPAAAEPVTLLGIPVCVPLTGICVSR